MAKDKRPPRDRSFWVGILAAGLFLAILTSVWLLAPLSLKDRGAVSSAETHASRQEARYEPQRELSAASQIASAQGGSAIYPADLQSVGADFVSIALGVAVVVCIFLVYVLIRNRSMFFKEWERLEADRQRLEVSEERYRLLALSSDVIVFDISYSDGTAEASENFESLLGQLPDLDNVLPVERIHPNERAAFTRMLQEAAAKPTSVSGELRLMDKSDKYVWFSVLLSSFADRQGKIVRLIGKMTNIDREKREKALLEFCAKTDMMTGLFNKAATEEVISLSITQNSNQTDALVILDVDDLKLINDTLGHAEGDRAILEVAETLKKHFRSTDIIGRVGGDEFMVFLRNMSSESKLRSSLSSLVQKLARIRLGETMDVQLHASIGAVISTGEDSFESLYRKADKALYFVKRNGKNDYAFYSPEMEQVNYRFTGNRPDRSARSDFFDSEELDQLLTAIATYFTLVIFVNLTKNTFYIIDCEYESGFPHDSGLYGYLVDQIGSIFYPQNKEEFYAAFSKEALFFIHERGEKTTAFEVTYPDEDDHLHRTCTTAIFVDPDKHGDICAILFIRQT